LLTVLGFSVRLPIGATVGSQATWQTCGELMAKVTSLPDNVEFDVLGEETLLEAARAGEAKEVPIFFSDITDFTSLAERLSAYDVMYLLNRYFVQAGDIIERNGGFIDKFVGDVSRNRMKLKVYPCRVQDGNLWIAIE